MSRKTMTLDEAKQWAESQDFYREVPGMNESYRRLLAFPVVILQSMSDDDPEMADMYVKAVDTYRSAIARAEIDE